jgi:filamentous hemagglutinin family protein
MNHVFRLVWNSAACNWAAAPETSSCRGGIVGGILLAACCQAQALPQGAQVSAGSGGVSSAGATMTVNQDSQRMAVNWQSFGIGAGEAVRFVQPNSSAIALNRVLGADTSRIAGRLSANGQVWLLNPNGVLFNKGAAVNVGSLLASTLAISDADFMAGKSSFTGSGTGGNVGNAGSIVAADRGYVAFLGGRVSNDGLIVARLGSVALAAGSAMTLDFAGDRLINVQVDAGLVDALAANNNGARIQADGGNVLMSARSVGAALQTAVNNTGLIQAQSVDASGSSIRLLGGPQDTVAINGTLDASSASPGGGPAGNIVTAGGNVRVADSASVLTGPAGNWLISANSFTVAASGGDSGQGALANALNNGNVTVQTTGGDIKVNASLGWGGSNSLTLSSQHDVNVNARIRPGPGAAVSLRADNAGACIAGAAASACGTVKFDTEPVFGNFGEIVANGGPVNLYYDPAGSNARADANGRGPRYDNPTDYSSHVRSSTSLQPLDFRSWMLVNDVNQLQAMSTNLDGSYALGRDIDASITSTWNQNTGFRAMGLMIGEFTPEIFFTGRLDGLNHGISGLYSRSNPENPGSRSGLFAALGQAAEVSNLALNDVDIKNEYAAALAGYNAGTVRNVLASGKVEWMRDTQALTVTTSQVAGGLVGVNTGTIANSGSSVSVTGNYSSIRGYAGGLVGNNDFKGKIMSSYASGPVTGTRYVGGLAAANAGDIDSSYATGAVIGEHTDIPFLALIAVGGLVGENFGGIRNSYAAGKITVDSTTAPRGGLVGRPIETGNGVLGLAPLDIRNNFWDRQATGVSKMAGTLDYVTDLSRISNNFGLATNELKSLATFTTADPSRDKLNPGWNFNTVWRIYEGQTYPLLKSFLKPLTVLPADMGTIYNGKNADTSLLLRQALPSAQDAIASRHLFGTSPVFDRSSTGDQPIAAGSYPYRFQLYSDQQGYDIAYPAGEQANLTISQAPLTVIARDDAKTFDGNPYNGGAGYTILGVQGGINPDFVFVNRSYGGSAQGASAVGSYAITPVGIVSGNYKPSYVDGTLTIAQGNPAAPAAPAAPIKPASIPNPDSYNSAVTQINAEVSAVNSALAAGSAIIIKTELSDQVRMVMSILAPGVDFSGTQTELTLARTTGGDYQYQLGFADKPTLKLQTGYDALLASQGIKIAADQSKLLLSADAVRSLLEGVSSRKGLVEATTIRTAPGTQPGLGAMPASSMEQVAGDHYPPS